MSLAGIPSPQRIGVVSVTVEAFTDAERFGEYDPQRDAIRIDPTMTQAKTAETVLHETLHSLVANHGIPDPDNDLCESWVSPLAPAQAAWMQRNPGAVLWLLWALAPEEMTVLMAEYGLPREARRGAA